MKSLFFGISLLLSSAGGGGVGYTPRINDISHVPDPRGELTRVVQSGLPTDTLYGLDMAVLGDLVSDIREGILYPDLHSLLIMRNGHLVLEEYFNGSYAEELHTLQSVTKSVASAAIGLAIEDGLIGSVNEKVVDFFPDRREELILDQRRARMRIEDVLTMRTGTDYHESGPNSPHAQLNSLSFGWDDFWLDRPMVTDPGTFWRYDSGGVIAASSMIKERYGHHADVYLAERLLGLLGIDRTRWFRNSEQHPHLGGGLFLRARDMLKFGQLYLQRGMWSGAQLVPEEWVDASFKRREVFDPPRGASGKAVGYGYLWWILEPDPAGDGQTYIYGALGYRSQYIFVIPEHEMIVVVTGWMPPAEASKPITFLYTDILPAVVSTTSVSTDKDRGPERSGVLEQSNPNPTSSTIKIGFSLPIPGRASIKLYDVLGREVATAYDGYVSSHRTEVHFDASALPRGIYLYRLESSDWGATRKMVVSR